MILFIVLSSCIAIVHSEHAMTQLGTTAETDLRSYQVTKSLPSGSQQHTNIPHHRHLVLVLETMVLVLRLLEDKQ